MTYEELKTNENALSKQARQVLNLLDDSGYKGINTVTFRNNLFIQMPTTRVFEINEAFKQHGILKKINKKTEKDRTATYYLVDINSQTGLFEKPQVSKAKFVVENGIYKAIL